MKKNRKSWGPQLRLIFAIFACCLLFIQASNDAGCGEPTTGSIQVDNFLNININASIKGGNLQGSLNQIIKPNSSYTFSGLREGMYTCLVTKEKVPGSWTFDAYHSVFILYVTKGDTDKIKVN